MDNLQWDKKAINLSEDQRWLNRLVIHIPEGFETMMVKIK
ncbi:MAG: hypothetical protein JWP81_374 [Ferruginibacter sp.]|nr:hypothetical protein [Ferruginibacter sp.]